MEVCDGSVILLGGAGRDRAAGRLLGYRERMAYDQIVRHKGRLGRLDSGATGNRSGDLGNCRPARRG